MDSKKQIIIREWNRDNKQSLSNIALACKSSIPHVSQVITKYAESLAPKNELCVAESFLFEGDYFLFNGITERRVKINNRTIQNPTDFSNYEMNWLKANLNVREQDNGIEY